MAVGDNNANANVKDRMMSGSDAYELMRLACRCIDGKHGTIILDENMAIMDGTTEDTIYFVTHRVGVKDFVDDPDGEFSYVQVAGALVTLFHEACGHGGMVFSEIRKETDLSKVLLLNHHACQGSPSYYGAFKLGDIPEDRRSEFVESNGDTIVLPRYFMHPMEIASQYAGFRSARLFLGAVWDEDTANECLCAYHNERVDDHIAYIEKGRKRKTVDEILGDLNKEFREKAFRKREYDSSLMLRDVIAVSGAAGRYATEVEKMRNGVKADALMTALFLKQNDLNSWRSEKNALVRISQDPERIIAMREGPVRKLFSSGRLDLAAMDEHVIPERFEDILKKPEAKPEEKDYDGPGG